MTAIRTYEMELYGRLVDGLESIRGVRIHGITDRGQFDRRTPTAALTIEGIAPRAVGRGARARRDRGLGRRLLRDRADRAARARRVAAACCASGSSHYNTAEEVDRLLESLERIAAGAAAVV